MQGLGVRRSHGRAASILEPPLASAPEATYTGQHRTSHKTKPESVLRYTLHVKRSETGWANLCRGRGKDSPSV